MKKRSSSEVHSGQEKDRGAYTVTLVGSARKELLALSDQMFKSVTEHLTLLGQNPRPFGSEKLTARREHKLRVGDMRIIYDIDDAEHKVISS